MRAIVNPTILSLTFIFLAACSSNPPGDVIPVSDEPEGPGVFTGDTGDFSFSRWKRNQEEKAEERAEELAKERGYYPPAGEAYYQRYKLETPAIDEDSFEDFELFKAWRRAQDPNSPQYQEYQDWRAYQDYRRFKAAQDKDQLNPEASPQAQEPLTLEAPAEATDTGTGTSTAPQSTETPQQK